MYVFNTKKLTRTVHILDRAGRTYCQIESSVAGRSVDGRSETIPDGRRVCECCLDLQARNAREVAA
jgi:hypothetical protein